MNQRGNYKHQTHIPTDYKHQTHSKITSTKPIYPHIGAIAARRRWGSALKISAICTQKGKENRCLGIENGEWWKKRRKWDIEKGKHEREERETELNRERRRSLLTDLAHPHALVSILKKNFKKIKKKKNKKKNCVFTFCALLSAFIFWALNFLELIREEENGGAERKREPCVWVVGESEGGKKKGEGDVYAGMVLRSWVRYGSHKK